MYRIGHRLRHHYVRYAAAVTVLIGLMIGLVAASWALLQPHTTLVQSKPVIKQVSSGDVSYRSWTTSHFSVSLPSDWATTAPPATPYAAVSYRGTTASSAQRRLDIYVGNIPTDLAVNRLLPVQAEGNQLLVTGVVSDNCVNFTDKTPTSNTSGVASSKWGGVNFLCDMGNYERHVVTIGSTEGVNTTTLKGAKSGSQRVLLVYTDNNINPSYDAFIVIVKSFMLL